MPALAGRLLAPSEAMHVEPTETVAYAVAVQGPLGVSALTRAFEASCRVHPVFTGCIRSEGASAELVMRDDRPVPAVQVRTTDGEPLPATRKLDHAKDLIGLEVSRNGGRSSVTLLTDHSLADARASLALLAEIWGHYTDIIATGQPTPLEVQPIPESLESLLAHRGVTRLGRSGVEALFEPAPGPDLHKEARPAGAALAARQVRRRIRFTADTTSALVRLGQANGLSIHGLVSAAVMIAHAQVAAEGPREVAVPFMYPVDVRARISPPVEALAGTNIFGTVGFKRSVGADTDPLVLAKALLEELNESVSDGVVQQSQLHFTGPDNDAPPPPVQTPVVLAADTTMLTNWGRIPHLRTPGDLTITDFRGAILDQPLRPVVGADPDAPPAPTSTYIVTTFDGRLSIELATAHTDARADAIIAALETTILAT
ncbi:hypothetical protein [Streptomyces sp. NPDC091371]|uniref:phthiocerol/phthiodiolone dimycocerosyl transferase family protein n=1 Tax=Streptomyces sp. NPDC091371 TaxID=3155303 RepID=UPI003435E042